MKKYLFLLLSVITLISCKSSAVFDCDFKGKILYMEMPNEVYVKNPDIHKLQISSEEADVKILNDTTMKIVPKKKGRVKIALKYQSKTRVINFVAQEVPSPGLSFRGLAYGPGKTMPLNEAKGSNKVGLFLPNFSYDCMLEIVSMDIDIIKEDGSSSHFTTNSNNLNGALYRAHVGDTYVFSNIKVQLVGGTKLNGADTVLKITEAEK